jgi:hypothetical protein
LMNGDAPAYGDYHLHLTTGDLEETSIFLGTDDHNVRTTTDGKIQITTPDTVNNVWEFDTNGELTLPTGGHIGPSGGKGAGTTYGGANDHLVSLTSYYNSGLYSSCVTAYADGTLNITAYNDGGPNPAKIWTFDNTGTLTLPDDSGIKSSTNIDITIDTPDSSTFNWRFGADGDLTLPRGYIKNDTTDGFVRIEGPLFADMVSAGGGGYATIANGVQILTHAVGDDTERKFNFSWDGSLYMPIASNNNQVGAIEWRNVGTATAQIKTVQGNATSPDGLYLLTYGTNTGTTIGAGFNKKWIFRDDGSLTIPGDIRSEGDINIDINLSDSTLRRWRFGEDGDLTLPIGVSIDANVDPLYPKIIADSGKLFSVQGQGSTGSAALAWSVDPNADTKYAAVGVNQGGGDNLAKVVMTAGNTTATLKVWKLDETGAFTFPDNTVQTTAWTGTTTGAITAESFNTDQITVVGNRITTTVTNANLELECNGSGGVVINTVADATTASTARSAGYLGLPQSATATSATLAISDAGKHIYVTTNSQTITIPAAASVDYPIGTTLTFIAGPDATTVSIAITSDTLRLAGGTSTGTRTLAANGMATAVKVAATTWYINGVGLT